jgi:hypothetical protein
LSFRDKTEHLDPMSEEESEERSNSPIEEDEDQEENRQERNRQERNRQQRLRWQGVDEKFPFKRGDDKVLYGKIDELDEELRRMKLAEMGEGSEEGSV